MDIETSRSYATEANLEAALKKVGFFKHRHLVVYNRDGRCTAIFPVSNVTTNEYGQAGNVMLYANRGFMTLG